MSLEAERPEGSLISSNTGFLQEALRISNFSANYFPACALFSEPTVSLRLRLFWYRIVVVAGPE